MEDETSERRDNVEPVPYMTLAQVSGYLQIPVQTLKNWRTAGRGPRALKLGSLVRYQRATVDAWAMDQLEPAGRA